MEGFRIHGGCACRTDEAINPITSATWGRGRPRFAVSRLKSRAAGAPVDIRSRLGLVGFHACDRQMSDNMEPIAKSN